MKNNRSFCIIGLGRFGRTLTDELIDRGHQVMVIDADPDAVNAVAEHVNNAVIGDATNESVLRSSGALDYDVIVIALSEPMEDSLLITLTLKDMGAQNIIARANSDPHKTILKKIEANQIIFPEKDMGVKVAHMISNSNVIEYFEFSDDYSIVKINVPLSWIGKNMIDLAIRRKYGVNVIAVENQTDENTHVSPPPQREFMEGDEVTLMGMNEVIEKIIGSLA